MRLGVISDIHGNRLALDAVLAELEREGIDEIVCLGDVAVGPTPFARCGRLRHLSLLNTEVPSGPGPSTFRERDTIVWIERQPLPVSR